MGAPKLETKKRSISVYI